MTGPGEVRSAYLWADKNKVQKGREQRLFQVVFFLSAESFLVIEVLGADRGGEKPYQVRNWSWQGGTGPPQEGGRFGLSPLTFSAEGQSPRGGTSIKRFPYFETLPWLFFHRRWWSSLIFGNQCNFSCSRNLKISSPSLSNSLSTPTLQKKKLRHSEFTELTQGNKGSQKHTQLNFQPAKGITCSKRWISNQVRNTFITEQVSSH